MDDANGLNKGRDWLTEKSYLLLQNWGQLLVQIEFKIRHNKVSYHGWANVCGIVSEFFTASEIWNNGFYSTIFVREPTEA